MDPVKKVKIGLLGAGTVGQSLLEILKTDAAQIERRAGIRFEVGAVFDRSFQKKPALIGYKAGNDPGIVLDDPDISIVIELIGGVTTARELMERALASGKTVVSANKALLASSAGPALFALAEKNNARIGFEAAVAGAIPVIRAMRMHYVSGSVRSLHGILNGTCNFIITRMESEGLDYGAALKLAQEKGFAEADPAFDVSGKDAAQKLAILAGLMFDSYVPESALRVEGIESIRAVDLRIARRMGYVIRLLAVARQTERGALLRVHPAMVPENHILASVKEERNAVFLESSTAGPALLVGKGAGGAPTATAVLSDLIDAATASGRSPAFFQGGPLEIAPESSYRFYLRMQTRDKPGVLADIARLLADRGISIASFHQEEGPEPVQLVLITHHASETAMKEALEQIDRLDSVVLPSVMIRKEDL